MEGLAQGTCTDSEPVGNLLQQFPWRREDAKLLSETEEILDGMVGLADQYLKKDQDNTAVYLVRQAYEISLMVCGAEDILTLERIAHLTLALWKAGQFKEIVKLLEPNVIEKIEKTCGPLAEPAKQVRRYLAGALRELGELERYINVLVEEFTLRENYLGFHDTRTVQSIDELARAYQAVGRHGEATDLLTRAYDAIRDGSCSVDEETITAVLDMAIVLFNFGRFEKAEVLQFKALSITEHIKYPEPPLKIRIVTGLVDTLWEQKKFTEIEALCSSRVNAIKEFLTQDDETVGESVRALLHAVVGKFKEAREITLRLPFEREGEYEPAAIKRQMEMITEYQLFKQPSLSAATKGKRRRTK